MTEDAAAGEAEIVDRMRYRMAAYTTAASIASKGLSLLVIYLSVPLTISYLGPQRFGVWMTLSSFISFLGFLDFGIGSSLVNEVAHLNAGQSGIRLTRLITHGLLVLTAFGMTLLVLMLVMTRTIDLPGLFNVRGYVDPKELRAAATMLSIMIGVSLPVVGLQRVFWGLQRAFIFHLLAAVGAVVSLGLLYFMALRHAGIAWLLFATFGVQLLASVPLLAILGARGLVGSFDMLEFRADARRLLGHGMLFFLLSVGGAVAWDSDYLIISRTSGAAAVAVYAVGVRLFQLVEIPLQMINTPLWSAYADAMARGSTVFLKKTLSLAFFGTMGAAILGCAVMLGFHDLIIRIWVRQVIVLPMALATVMAAWTVIRASGNAFAMYLNGLRIVKPQVFVVLLFCAIGIPLKIYCSEKAGPTGLVVASMASYILASALPYLTIFRRDWIRPMHGSQL